MCNHTEIARRYAARRINKRTGTVEWTGSRVFCKNDIIYSYGRHFPMAKYLGEVNGQHIFVKNGDRYSSSTSGHQGNVQQFCKGPTVARSALNAAGFEFTSLTLDNILDYQCDMKQWLYRELETGKFYKHWNIYGDSGQKLRNPSLAEPFPKPKQGMWIPGDSDKDEQKHGIERGTWHTLGAVVLTKDDEYYLASLDEGQYFVAQLPGKPKNIKDAFALLQPPEVQQAFRRKLNVKRQGEWFFVPTGLSTRDFRDKLGLTVKAFERLALIVPLPERPLPSDRPAFDRRRNKHVCRQYFVVNEGIYVNGFVRHKDERNHATQEHRTLKLGDEWHKAYMNTEIESWTRGGRFD